MKLSTLLVKYLHTHKRLDIPGIGTLSLTESAPVTETTAGRHSKSVVLTSVNFENNPSTKESDDLISFISEESGKMKALATADLRSHLEIMNQFLNMGKPYLLEGIGNLIKPKTGIYEFTATELIFEKIVDSPSKRNDQVKPANKKQSEKYESFLDKDKTKGLAIKKPLAVLFTIAGIGLAVWAGYYIANRNNNPNNVESAPPVATNTSTIKTPKPIFDTLPQKSIDSINTPIATTTAPEGNYKFVLEMASRKRAFERFNRLKTYAWPVQMETKDSVAYKLFMILPVNPIDTTRILDSLSALNGRKVLIER